MQNHNKLPIMLLLQMTTFATALIASPSFHPGALKCVLLMPEPRGIADHAAVGHGNLGIGLTCFLSFHPVTKA